MQYHTFVLTPRINRALSIINAPEKLNSLSVAQLISLKADLFNYTHLTMDEFFDALNSSKRRRIKEYNDMDYKEQKIFKALEKLNQTARKRMQKITNDFKNGNKTEKYEDIHNLSFAFRNNGYNYANYPEITPMNSEVSWYKHQKKFSVQRNTNSLTSYKLIRGAKRLVKVATLGAWAFIGNYFINGDQRENISSEFDFQKQKIARVMNFETYNVSNDRTYMVTAKDFYQNKKDHKNWNNSKTVKFNQSKQNSNA